MYLWIFQNVMLVVSSIWRMMLYVEAYSLTYTRVAVLIWMGLVALGLVLIVVRFALDRSNLWLVNANVIALMSVLYLSCFVNFGGLIASYNVTSCREMTGKGTVLDLAYMRELGPVSLPALRRYIAESANRNFSQLEQARSLEARLTEVRAQRLANWRGWTWRHYRAGRMP